MKKFINRPENVVDEMLDGLSALHPGLKRLAGHKVLTRADMDKARDHQVALISGGGSGHEPAHAGYLGAGMLSAAVAGEVFTSPSSDEVFAAIRAVAGKPGALLIVKNYTGDRLNFGLAAEMARGEGIPVEMIVVDDDAALQGGRTGARGLAGTVLIHKLMGAAAAEGKTLPELAALGREAISALSTMGVSFSAGTSPAVGRPSFELGEQEMELGLGIHGEPGVERKPVEPADQLTETLLRHILEQNKLGKDKRAALLINNLGATTEMELAIVARHALTFLSAGGINVERAYAGTFLSSLDMAGISISLLGLTEDRLRWLDAPTTAPAWPNTLAQSPTAATTTQGPVGQPSAPAAQKAHTEQGNRLRRTILAACEALLTAEPELTELDRITGDGDLGVSMARGAAALESAVDAYPLDNVAATLTAVGHTLRRELGGSSGPLYGVLFLRCGHVLVNGGRWTEALRQGAEAISQLGGAHPGDRTMLDALDPFVAALEKGETVMAAVAAAERGAEATAAMKPRLGRSSYLGDRVLGHPDPGAKAMAIWLRAACEAAFPKNVLSQP